jgi:hypothetical protein
MLLNASNPRRAMRKVVELGRNHIHPKKSLSFLVIIN